MNLDACYGVSSMFRLQWEEVQKAWVLLYPEGVVKLNGSAGEILSRLKPPKTIQQVVAELEQAFNQTNLASDVQEFLLIAAAQGWVKQIELT